MASQALYSKWRPMTFEDVVGQEHVTYTLRSALASGRLGHAYLFSGPRGTGKTTMARLLAKAANCQYPDPAARPCNTCDHCLAVNEGRYLDLIEIDAASHTSVDDVRELRDRIAFAPNEGQYKVYIVDEVHRFSGAAFDALLKTIEEPPAHAIFVLATTEIHKVPQTILSRCQRFDFRRIPLHQIVERLAMILEYEGIMAEQAALELVARQATGSLRDAISLLDQLITGQDEVLTLELAQAILGTTTDQSVRDLTSAILMGDTGWGLDIINRALEEGSDPRQFARQMVDYLRLVMLVQTGGPELATTTITEDELVFVEQHAEQFPRSALLQTLRSFNEAANDQRTGWQPQLPLEIAFIESVDKLHAAPQPEPPPAPAQSSQRPARERREAPPAPDEQAGDSEPPPQPGSITTAQVQERWRSVLKTCRSVDKVVEALLNSGSIVGVEGNAIILQMPSDMLRDKIEHDQNRQIIESVLQQVYGLPLTVRARAGSSVSVQSGNQRSREIDDIVASDPLVSFMVNELGGSIKRIESNEE